VKIKLKMLKTLKVKSSLDPQGLPKGFHVLFFKKSFEVKDSEIKIKTWKTGEKNNKSSMDPCGVPQDFNFKV